MPNSLLPVELRQVERCTRLVQILSACAEVGMVPVTGAVVHVFAYLTDALAPVWHLPIVNAQLLKRESRPFFPVLQRDLDGLVGSGVVVVDALDYGRESSNGWRLAAWYRLNADAARPVLELSSELDSQAASATFVREVVLAGSGLGDDELNAIGRLDAAYSNEITDIGEVLDLETQEGGFGARAEVNQSAAVAVRLGELASASFVMSDSELIHMYIRHLYSRARVA
ncbi:hypothetical protein [Cellulosimicrobium sp. RS]|uniref:hypothetical protein n=1 Tax=Cellulosimicrobium sp. RS TaxID=3381347 RepID=UPI0038FC734E